MGFSRQEDWSRLSCLPPGDLPSPGMEPRSPTWQANSEPPEKPTKHGTKVKKRRKEIRGPFSVSSSDPRLPWALAVAGPSMQPEKCNPFCRWRTRGPQPAGGSSSFIITVYWSPDTSGPLAAPLQDAPWNMQSGPPLEGQGEGGGPLVAEDFLDPGHVGGHGDSHGGFEDVSAFHGAEGQDSGHLASSAQHRPA